MIWCFLLQGQSPASPIVGFLPILLIFAIFYFLLFLPMQRQRKRQQKLLKELQPGQLVVTTGGIVGTIVSLDEETVILRVKPDSTKLQFSRNSVAGLVAEKK